MKRGTAHNGFRGFSPAALKFLRDLAKHNERAWFQPRKELFERELLAPLEAMIEDADAAMRKAKIPLHADPRRSRFRIYRDIRFSRDKRPYKTNLGAYLSPGSEHFTPGGLYVHIQPGESFMSVAFYELDNEHLLRWRTALAEDPAKFQRMLRALAKNGLKLSDQHVALKRMPRGFEAHATSPIATYFRLGSFTVSRNLSDKEVTSPRLVQTMVAFVKKAKPFMEYGYALNE
jgi:uncharacterized protein (TIGR02453 family)